MKLALIYAKLLHGKGGTFRVLMENELLDEGDIEIGKDYAQSVCPSAFGLSVKKGEVIVRLTLEK